MEENIDWLFDDPLLTVEDVKTEVKDEADCEDQLHDGTGVKMESTVKEEVQVKEEREDKASVFYWNKMNGKGDWHALPYVPLKRETDLGGSGSLEMTGGEQCQEGGSVCEQEQSVDRAPGWGRWKVMRVEGGVYGREESGKGDTGREEVVQPWVSMEDCKVEVKSECSEETGVERLGEGEKVQEEGDMPVQGTPSSSVVTGVGQSVCGAQWSDASSALVASSSSSPQVCEAIPCVSSEETARLSRQRKRPCGPPKQQQQGRKKARVQSAGGDAHQEARAVSGSHAKARSGPGGVKKHGCSYCDYRCVLKKSLKRHVDTVHKRLRKHACPNCQYRAGRKDTLMEHIASVHEGERRNACPYCQYRSSKKNNLQRHIETVHEGLRKHACPHCAYRAGEKANLQTHIDAVHEGLRKYACPHCQYKAGCRSHLQRHIQSVHEGIKKFACPHCQFRTGRKGDLAAHIEIVHRGVRKHACPLCHYRGGRKAHLRRHMDIMHKDSK